MTTSTKMIIPFTFHAFNNLTFQLRPSIIESKIHNKCKIYIFISLKKLNHQNHRYFLEISRYFPIFPDIYRNFPDISRYFPKFPRNPGRNFFQPHFDFGQSKKPKFRPNFGEISRNFKPCLYVCMYVVCIKNDIYICVFI